ncbi:unnamed protein product [Ixodes hexagonus]
MAGRSEAVLFSLLLLLIPGHSRNTGLHPDSVVILNPTGAPRLTDVPVRDSSFSPNIPVKSQAGAGSTEASASTPANVASGSPGDVPTNLPTDISTANLPSRPATDVVKTGPYTLDKNDTIPPTSPVTESSPITTYPPGTSRRDIFDAETTTSPTDAVTATSTEWSSTSAAVVTSPTPDDLKGALCAAPDLPRWRPVPKTHRLRLSRANAACAPSCDSNQTRDEAPGATLSLSIQNLDEIQLDLDPSLDWWPDRKNGSVSSRATELRLTLQSLREGVAGHPCSLDDSLLLWNKIYAAPGIAVGPEVLTPGSHALSLHLSGSELGCGVGQAAWLLNVSVHARDCSKSPQDSAACFGGGACVLEPGQASFACRCCPGLGGRFCEERDGCFGRPCLNGGFCVDIAEGLTGTMFKCLCPRGFRGRRCEERLGPCETLSCPQGTRCVPLANGSRSCEDDITPPPSAAASAVPDPPTTGTVPVAPKPDAAPEAPMSPAAPVAAIASATSSSTASSQRRRCLRGSTLRARNVRRTTSGRGPPGRRGHRRRPRLDVQVLLPAGLRRGPVRVRVRRVRLRAVQSRGPVRRPGGRLPVPLRAGLRRQGLRDQGGPVPAGPVSSARAVRGPREQLQLSLSPGIRRSRVHAALRPVLPEPVPERRLVLAQPGLVLLLVRQGLLGRHLRHPAALHGGLLARQADARRPAAKRNPGHGRFRSPGPRGPAAQHLHRGGYAGWGLPHRAGRGHGVPLPRPPQLQGLRQAPGTLVLTAQATHARRPRQILAEPAWERF